MNFVRLSIQNMFQVKSCDESCSSNNAKYQILERIFDSELNKRRICHEKYKQRAHQKNFINLIVTVLGASKK